VEHLHFAYEKARPVFQDFSLDLREGEAIALLGDNGAGKTTLLRLAKGLLKPGAGRVRAASGRPLMKEVGLVFQNPDDGLFAASVEDECAFLPRNLGLARPRDRARAVLDRLGMAGMAGRVPFTLSYGEKRRVSLAAVLAGGARILCLDEPTAGLDRANLAILAELLREHARAGGGVLFATHDPAFAAAVATRTVRLDGGGRDR
jgi:energy-coupling factor transport system ATP-binding protein